MEAARRLLGVAREATRQQVRSATDGTGQAIIMGHIGSYTSRDIMYRVGGIILYKGFAQPRRLAAVYSHIVEASSRHRCSIVDGREMLLDFGVQDLGPTRAITLAREPSP